MPYQKTIWEDRVVEKPRTYTIANNPDGTVTLTPAPGTVVQEGTPVNAERLNNLESIYEKAIADAIEGIQVWTVAPGESISLHDVVQAVAGGIRRIQDASLPPAFGNLANFSDTYDNAFLKVCALSSTCAVVAYREPDNDGVLVPLALDGKEVVGVGAPVVFEGTDARDIALLRLDDTRGIVAYRDYSSSSSGPGRLFVFSVIDNVLTLGPSYTYEAGVASDNSMTLLAPDRAIIVFYDYANNNYGTAAVVSIAGTSVSSGFVGVFRSALVRNPTVARIDDERVLVAYNDGSSNGGMMIVTCYPTIAGGAHIDLGAKSIAVFNLGDGSIAQVYRGGTYCQIRAVSVSGDSVSLGSSADLPFTDVDAVCPWGNSRAVVAYRDSADSYKLKICIITFNGLSAPSVSDPLETGDGLKESAVGRDLGIAAQDSARVVMAFNTSTNGSIRIIETLVDGSTAIGVAKEDAEAGASCRVAMGPLVKEFADLVPGAIYYLQREGVIGLLNSGARIGVAVSDTVLKLK